MSQHDAEHDRLRSLLGAYALDQLDEAEKQKVVLHLFDCDECRADLDEIGPAADGLRDLRDGAVSLTGPLVVPAGLGDSVLAAVGREARRERGRRRLQVLAGAGAAAALVASVVTAAVLLRGGGDTATPRVEPVRVVETDRTVTASAAAISHRWGVELELHARGLVSGERYVVTVQGTDGSAHEAGEFVGTGAREIDCHLSSALPLDRATGFVVSDHTGAVRLTGSFERP